MIRLVIWDFDGTIVDSEGAHWKAFNRILEEERMRTLTWKEYEKDAISFGDDDFFAWALGREGRATPPEDVRDLSSRKQQPFLEEMPSLVPYQGVIELIKEVSDNRLLQAVATSATPTEAEVYLGHHDVLERFATIIGATDFSNPKPSPECFLLALRRVNAARGEAEAIAPHECLVIEDTPSGVSGAKAAGMRCWAVTNTHTAEQLSQSDRALDTLVGCYSFLAALDGDQAV